MATERRCSPHPAGPGRRRWMRLGLGLGAHLGLGMGLGLPGLCAAHGAAAHPGRTPPPWPEQTDWGRPGQRARARTVVVRMSDALRFSPNRLQVKLGETLRLVAHNDGRRQPGLGPVPLSGSCGPAARCPRCLAGRPSQGGYPHRAVPPTMRAGCPPATHA